AAIYNDAETLLAVAGATANSERMWEMGVNSFAEGKGYAISVLSALTQEILNQGKVPYSGTAISHLASQNVSLRAGLFPTFCELTTKKSER
ncbi:MAG: GNAT family N-acetyltransferase, partial [Clostridiales bacterium]|nr:GNAT family N-acetyltransferase [Clostridiales bacterium]